MHCFKEPSSRTETVLGRTDVHISGMGPGYYVYSGQLTYLTSIMSTFVKYVSCLGDTLRQGPIPLRYTISLRIMVWILLLGFITPHIKGYPLAY
jgi:hypothetical protein